MKSKAKTVRENFKETFSKRGNVLLAVITFFILEFLFYWFTDVENVRGNLGNTYLWLELSSQVIVALLMALFITLSVYKFRKYSRLSFKENSTSFVGSFLGIVVTGCPACSITIASFIGLAGFISLLPWKGLELKLISIILLLYATSSILVNLNVCKVKKR